MSHVFIIYSKKNKHYAQNLVHKLTAEGFDVWLDDNNLRSGLDWWVSIIEAIYGCGACIVLMTPQSDDSDWVQQEIMLAMNKDKPLFPLWLSGPVDTTNWSIFPRTQYRDVRDGSMPADEFFDRLARYARRNAQSGQNVTFAGHGQSIANRVDNDPILREALANPPERDEDYRHFLVRLIYRSPLVTGIATVLVVVAILIAITGPGDPPIETMTPAIPDVIAPLDITATLDALNNKWLVENLSALRNNELLENAAAAYTIELLTMSPEERDAITRHRENIETAYPGNFEVFVQIQPEAPTVGDVWSWFTGIFPETIDRQKFGQIGFAQATSPDNLIFFVLILGDS